MDKDEELSIRRQCELLKICRSMVYCLPKGEPEENLRLMHLMGIGAVYPRKRTTIPGARSGIYPYLLRGLEISRSNQVWCADITYIPMAKGFMYLFAGMDWHSRKVLAW